MAVFAVLSPGHLHFETDAAEDPAAEILPAVDMTMARWCSASASLVIAIGLVVLLGWLFMIEPLKRIFSGFVAMNPMTAVSFIIAGSSLLLRRTQKTTGILPLRMAQIMSLAVAAIGTAKLITFFSHSDLMLDHWLFTDELRNDAVSLPNRMAPNTAAALVLCGFGLLAIDWKIGSCYPSELFSVAIGIIGIFALIGYAYRAPVFYGVQDAVPMALHTAVGLLALAMGMLLSRPRRGLMAVVGSDTAGGIIARRSLPLALILPVGIGILRLYGQAQGWFDAQSATALQSTALVVVFAGVIWWMACVLFRIDTERKYITRWQSEKLERTVQTRTAQLENAVRQLKETQHHVLQQERLHALGTMASGVTHDFNNALSVIIGFGEMALRECETKSDTTAMERYLRPMVVAALDGAKVVTRLREFYRPGGHQEPTQPVDLNQLVEQAIAITEPKWKSQRLSEGVRIAIRTDLGEIPAATGDAAELREALANLVFNAVDAMPNGGTITLRTWLQDDRVMLVITDTGIGMSAEVKKRCLDPFFTTKGERGTGLGLAMVYGIVERHGGTLTIDSELGRGTSFTLSLPEYIPCGTVPEQMSPAAASPLHVLIADDQPLLCEILAEYLKNDCHSVVVAHDGRDALKKFEHERFDLVITDQAMPEMTGNQLAQAIKKRSPQTPVILLTGFGEATGEGAQIIDEVLSKPVSLVDLRQALVRAATNREPSVPTVTVS